MSDYSSMSHQQLYNNVFSGAPSNVESEATLNQSHSKSVSDATTELKKTLTNIQASWSGSAADEFSQQANAIVQQMEQHAQDADTTYTWMNYASQSLDWAQKNMPSPPSGAEQDLANVNSNPVSEWGIGILSGGTSYLASKAAAEDISKKKAAAVTVMTHLASAYTTSNQNLSSIQGNIEGGTDVDPVNGSSTSSKSKQNDNGGSASGSGGSGSNSSGMIMPMSMPVPSSGGTGGDGGFTPPVSTGAGSVHASTGSSSTPSSGVTDSKLPTTVTSGLGDLPPSGTTTGMPSGVSSPPAGGGLSGGGVGGIGGLGAGGGLAGFGGGGVAGLSEGGASGSTRGSKSGVLSDETGTGELGEEAGGTGYGSPNESNSSVGGSGSAAGEAEGAGSAGSQEGTMGGGMGGMGHGAGGGQEERGSRASWLKEDPDYWYSDKMKNAAPPGGVIG